MHPSFKTSTSAASSMIAPRDGDQERGRFHPAQRPADEAARPLVERAVDRDKVAAREEIVEGCDLHAVPAPTPSGAVRDVATPYPSPARWPRRAARFSPTGRRAATLSCSSKCGHAPRWQRSKWVWSPRASARICGTSEHACASTSVIAMCAIASVEYVGMLQTVMPFRFAADSWMLLNPVLASQISLTDFEVGVNELARHGHLLVDDHIG